MISRDKLDAYLLKINEILALPDEAERERCINVPLDFRGLQSLHIAVLLGDAALLQKILDAKAGVNDATFEGKTPLHYAVDTKKKEVIDLLIHAGANIDLVDNEGFTPFKDHKIIRDLHQGPRMRSPATIDFEIVLRAFISAEPPDYALNSFGEIEVDVKGTKYNLTKILEHKPDLEHLELHAPSEEQVAQYRTQYNLPAMSAEEREKFKFAPQEEIDAQEKIADEFFRKLTTYQLNLDSGVPLNKRENMVIYEVFADWLDNTEKGMLALKGHKMGLMCNFGNSMAIPWEKLPPEFPRDFTSVKEIQAYLPQIVTAMSTLDTSVLTEAEARSIRYWTMDRNNNAAYRKINSFLRDNGKISNLMDKGTADLRTIMFELAYLPRALAKLRETNDNEKQVVYRGESYDTEQLAQSVIKTRTKNTLHLAPGFISTSTEVKTAKNFSRGAPVNLSVAQVKNSFAVDISQFSEMSHEKEKLMTTGAQSVYIPKQGSTHELIALPVRSIDEIYANSYDREVIQWRDTILKCVDNYSKSGSADAALINCIDIFCAEISLYRAGEIEKSLNFALGFTLSDLKKIKPTNEEMHDTIETVSSIAVKIANHLNTKLITQINDNHVELIKAAQYTYDNYYKHPYKDLNISSVDDKVTIDDVTIQRPNHNLTHNLRKSLFMPVIVNLLKAHASDPILEEYLSSIDQFKMKVLQISLVFSNTGRESEVGARDNIEVYNSYREKSKENFLQYAKETGLYHPDPVTDRMAIVQNKFIDTMAEELRYMGNPEYFKKVTAPDYVDPENGFIFIMLNLAHRLDLQRCFDVDKYKSTMKQMEAELSGYVDEKFNRQAMPILYSMASDSIAMTGDRRMTVYEEGKFINSNDMYAKNFANASQNVEICIRMCFKSNPIFSEVMDGKLKMEISDEGMSSSPLCPAIMNADFSKISKLMSDPDNTLKNHHSEAFLKLVDVISRANPPTFDAIDLMKTNLYLLIKRTPQSLLENLKPVESEALLYFSLTQRFETLAVSLLTSMGNNINTSHTNEAGETALYLAAKNDMLKVIDTLKELKSDVNIADKEGLTPIEFAINNGRWAVVSKLLNFPNINFTSEVGDKIYLQAMTARDAGIISILLKLKLPINLENTLYQTENPLMMAIRYERFDLIADTMKRVLTREIKESFSIAVSEALFPAIRAMLENDTAKIININKTYHGPYEDKRGVTLVYLAARERDAALLSALLKMGATDKSVFKIGNLAPEIKSILALHQEMLQLELDSLPIIQAAKYNEWEKVKVLLDDPNNLTTPICSQLLCYAVTNCAANFEIIQRLSGLENLIDLSVSLDGDTLHTPLALAVEQGDFNVVCTLLLEVAAHNSINNDLVISAFYEAIRTEQWSVAKAFILTRSIHLNQCEDWLLRVLVEAEQHKLLRDIFSTGDSREAIRDSFMNLLSSTKEYNNATLSLFSALLNDDPWLVDPLSTEATPLHVAAENNSSQLAELLIKHGSKPNVIADYPGVDHQTPLEVALTASNWDVARLLVQHTTSLNFNWWADTQMYVLEKALITGNPDIVDKLFDISPPSLDLDDDLDSTLLHKAASLGCYELGMRLIQRGASINAADDDGLTPVDVIAASDKRLSDAQLASREKFISLLTVPKNLVTGNKATLFGSHSSEGKKAEADELKAEPGVTKKHL